jgi:single-strand DNA-binding protein
MRDSKGRFLKRMKDALSSSVPATLELEFSNPEFPSEAPAVNVVPASSKIIPNAQQRARRSSSAMSATTTVIGNLTAEPELRQTNNGKSVINFSLAYTPRRPDGSDGQTSFYEITAWEYLADNIAASVKKGDRLLVVGRLSQQKWEDADGKNRSKLVITADEVCGTMRFHTLEMSRTAKRAVVEDSAPDAEVEAEDIFA